jgi:hypothetical protein
MDAYFLHGVDGEKLIVIRGHNEELMQQVITTLGRSRNDSIKKLSEVLENHFNERHDYGGSLIQTRPENKKNGRKRR